jgi:ribosomal protein S18 acetylase RimI-like enzyme
MNNEEYKIIDHEFPNVVMEFLEDKLYENNSNLVGKNDGKHFSKIVNDENNSIIAGITGWRWANACEIITLWVDAQHRKKGLGGKLLEEAEKDAINSNCKIIILRSYSFQAPSFYEKYGYKIEYAIDDFPPGNKYYHLVKRL